MPVQHSPPEDKDEKEEPKPLSPKIKEAMKELIRGFQKEFAGNNDRSETDGSNGTVITTGNISTPNLESNLHPPEGAINPKNLANPHNNPSCFSDLIQFRDSVMRDSVSRNSDSCDTMYDKDMHSANTHSANTHNGNRFTQPGNWVINFVEKKLQSGWGRSAFYDFGRQLRDEVSEVRTTSFFEGGESGLHLSPADMSNQRED